MDVTSNVFYDGFRWVATIYDWWYATGATEAEAVKRVAENYEKEMDGLHGQDSA